MGAGARTHTWLVHLHACCSSPPPPLKKQVSLSLQVRWSGRGEWQYVGSCGCVHAAGSWNCLLRVAAELELGNGPA